MNDTIYLHALNLLPQLGPKKLLLLSENFPNYKSAFFSNRKNLLALGFPEKLISEIENLRTKLNIEEEINILNKFKIKLLDYKNINCPKLLLEVSSFPPLLYYRGIMNSSEELMLGVVGTRKITNYGRTALPIILEPIIEAGLVVVSGLAYGVDAAAHKLCVDHGKRTVAVLGCGLDDKTIYPKEHLLLAEQIIEKGGALLSEHPPGRAALKQNFVARNRIISGLSLGTLVVECSLKSGALITARHALDQNRQVYAVPGQIYNPESQGPNNLLKMGAKCVTKAEDILEDLNIKTNHYQNNLPEVNTTPDEKVVLENLSFEPIEINILIKNCNLEAAKVTACLTFLEMKGRVRNLGGSQYALARKL